MNWTPEQEQAIRESIAHWDRMIAWAENQPVDGRRFRTAMQDQIGESWYGEHCALCREFYVEQDDECESAEGDVFECSDCPIVLGGNRKCMIYGSIWGNLDTCKTWGEWLTAAREMRGMLAGLLEVRA
jgi:hypothetical protein